MAKYCAEKFENQNGEEVVVCWRQDKHVHDAGTITVIEQRLQNTRGGSWSVRSGSYRSNLSSCPVNSVDYDEL